MKRSCEECSNFSPITIQDDPCGQCRRYPPKIVEVFNSPSDESNFDSVSVMSHWPIVSLGDWCGEFKSIE